MSLVNEGMTKQCSIAISVVKQAVFTVGLH
jgi:hypothetical protein